MLFVESFEFWVEKMCVSVEYDADADRIMNVLYAVIIMKKS